MKKILRHTVLIMLIIAAGAGCTSQDNAPQKKLPTAIVSINGIKLTVELAVTEAQKEKGLMFRNSVPDGTGMLFVYYEDRPLTFWMKNTKVPLSIAFIASDGTIVDIVDMQPYSLAPVPSSRSVRYALEVSQGWFAKHTIKPGDKVDLSDVLTKI
ncbi:MAG TPA: DUF192 domain-containing protein [Spirochaetia bacterium]|nr:DUF192 domain-containing protein [Spirochaetales bacterium]HPD80200.1 DUF192 domain-containing protein [Spirochaetales bacterium]HQG40619.1 DUF192 domain-containing protein [Spirochaetales bacterium]HQK33363.1 DUF192 domain-containing protein [Spirochaetales bacterium]HRS66964.1 DUF192 domain-containing protein [Spirochaetia bacterium]